MNHTQYYVLLYGDGQSPMSMYRAFVTSTLSHQQFTSLRSIPSVLASDAQPRRTRRHMPLTFILVQTRQDTQSLFKQN
jgi:hypothetical protein